jgi:hypothetical protein
VTEYDKVDLLTCFESEPEIGEDALWYRYTRESSSYRVTLELWPYDEDVHVVLNGPGQVLPLVEVWLHSCHAVQYGRTGPVEELQFINRDYSRSQANTFKSMRLRVHPEVVIDVTR